MQACDRVLVIANPTSGGGLAGRWLERVVAALGAAGLRADAVVTEGPGDAEAAARECGGGRPLLVAFGGDGTLNEVLNGADLTRSTLALVPAGTGNVLAKELGMSARPLRAVQQIVRGRMVAMDVGTCNGRRFACVFGAGLDAWVVGAVHRMRGRRLSKLHYLPLVGWAVMRRPDWGIEVEMDGVRLAAGLGLAVIGNTHSYGGPIELTPAADPHDGLLDIMCTRLDGVPDTLWLSACALLRSTDLSRVARYARGRAFTVRARAPDVPYQIDGEAAGDLPATVGLLPAAARMLVPATYRAPSHREETGR